jgi:3-oxoacyl-[acyl-carrier protein] reductase
MSRKLEGKIALVTGGSRGIGAAIAKRLAADGASEQSGGKALAIQADAANADAVKAAVQKTVATLGSIDVLVNNAGTAIPKLFEETTLEDIDRMMNINVRGMLVATQAALKQMKNGGRIINIGSCVGERDMTPGLVAYAARREPSRCSRRVCPERWAAGPSRSTTFSRARSTRI